MSDQSRSGNFEANSAPNTPANARPHGLRITKTAFASALGAAALASCAPAPEPIPLPPPPPPPPPPVEIIPYRPLPPNGAAYVMAIPPFGSDGKRITINRGLSDDEKVWSFRSGWNVAALNCTAPQYAPIDQAYTTFVNQHQKALKRVNDRLERRYREEQGSRRAAIIAREAKLTSTYNFFALPPARGGFCRAMLEMSNRAIATPPTDPVAFAMANFALLEAPFDAFFREYEQYERDSAAWDMRYGAEYGPSQPGWVAVQKARSEGNPNVPAMGFTDPTSALVSEAQPAGSVPDATTGVAIPIIPVDENIISQPVVEPIANDPTDGTTAVPPADTDGSGNSPE